MNEGDRACDLCEYVAVDSPQFSTPPATRLTNHKWKQHTSKGVSVAEPVTPTDPEADGTGPYGAPVEPDPSTGEVPPASGAGRSAGPAPRRRGVLGFLKRDSSKTPAEPRATREKAPKPARSGGKRESAAELLGLGWGGAGTLLQRSGHVPTGRMVKFQAPVAGEVLDDAVKGTALDKMVLQRLVGAKGTLDALYAIVGPPVYTWQLEKALAAGNADAVAYLEEMLKGCIRDSLPVMLPAMKKQRKREAESNKAMAELLDDGDLDALGVTIVDGQPVDADGRSVDVADVFVAMLFSQWDPPVGPPADAPAETENVT